MDLGTRTHLNHCCPSEVLPDADQSKTLSMDQFEKIETLGRGAHGASCSPLLRSRIHVSFCSNVSSCFKHLMTYPYKAEFVVDTGVAILVKPKYAGTSASLRVAEDPVAKLNET